MRGGAANEAAAAAAAANENDEYIRGAQFGVAGMPDAAMYEAARVNNGMWRSIRALPPVIANPWDHHLVLQAQDRALPSVINENGVPPEFRGAILDMLKFAIVGLCPMLPQPERVDGGIPAMQWRLVGGLHRQLIKLEEEYPVGAALIRDVAEEGVSALRNDVPEVRQAVDDWNARQHAFSRGMIAAMHRQNADQNGRRGRGRRQGRGRGRGRGRARGRAPG